METTQITKYNSGNESDYFAFWPMVTLLAVEAINTNSRPGRSCCTVTIGGQNVVEALVSKGYAAVVRTKSTAHHKMGWS